MIRITGRAMALRSLMSSVRGEIDILTVNFLHVIFMLLFLAYMQNQVQP